MRKVLARIVPASLFSFDARIAGAQFVEMTTEHNEAADLMAQNWGDLIYLSVSLQEGAATYIVYRSVSDQGGWVERMRASDKELRDFANSVQDITSYAQERELCYKVEAIDSVGRLLRDYEPVCVPRYVPPEPWTTNEAESLGGLNHGNYISLMWGPVDKATQYVLYLAVSREGPWSVLCSDDGKGRCMVHTTPDARMMDLCYKVEAKDAKGAVIKTYEPICVPRYAG